MRIRGSPTSTVIFLIMFPATNFDYRVVSYTTPLHRLLPISARFTSAPGVNASAYAYTSVDGERDSDGGFRSAGSSNESPGSGVGRRTADWIAAAMVKVRLRDCACWHDQNSCKR